MGFVSFFLVTLVLRFALLPITTDREHMEKMNFVTFHGNDFFTYQSTETIVLFIKSGKRNCKWTKFGVCIKSTLVKPCQNSVLTQELSSLLCNHKLRKSHFIVIRQRCKSQNQCLKKTKHAKFSHIRTRVSGGKKCSFFRKFGGFCFLEIPILRFALLPTT